MPRRPREKCENSIYHIMVRGNNQQAIFLDDYDRQQFLKRLKRYKEKFKIHVYSYCLMSNHVHLLIYDNGQDISKVMQGLNLSYTIYFNKRHECVGHLFQDRFKSVMVRNDAQFMQVSKYIHLNPVNANMVREAKDYRWSSYRIYMGEYDAWRVVDKKIMLGYFSDDYTQSLKLYLDYMKNTNVEQEIAVTLSNETIFGNMETKKEIINPEKILDELVNYFGVDKKDLINRTKEYLMEKDISMYILSLKCKLNYRAVSKIFNLKLSTVGARIMRVVNLMIKDENIASQVEKILSRISNNTGI